MLLKLIKKNFKSEIQENNWKGTGTKENPLIIEKFDLRYSTIRLKELDIFINIKNCDFKTIIIHKSQHIIIENCNFKDVILDKCQGISIENCKFRNFRLLRLCSSIIIRNNCFKKISPWYCQSITIVNNKIKKLSLYQFENNKKLRKKFFYTNIMFLLAFLVYLSIISYLFLGLPSFFLIDSIIFLLIIVSPCNILLLGNSYKLKKSFSKIKNRMSNNIVENNN